MDSTLRSQTRTSSLHSDFQLAFHDRMGQVLSRAEIREILEVAFDNFPVGSVVPTDHAEPSSEHVNQCRHCANPDYQIFDTVIDGKGRDGEARYRVRAFMSCPAKASPIDLMPRFALTSASVPKQLPGPTRQANILYQALSPFPSVQTLDGIVERCRELGYKVSKPERSFLWNSVLYHLTAFKKSGCVREE